ncbi:MAG: hypothetical protein J07HX64_00537 [halophilic archaeon J07HX64]|nr:MAG: hypothetical protein J07HX64_00537 [halophilic archaeon J07HX64]
MAYNLESFELFVVSIPRTRRVASYILGVSVFAGLLTAAALQFGADLGWTVELSALDGTAVSRTLVLVVSFAVAALVGGETTQLLVPVYPRNWGYYLALVCLVLVGVLVPVGVLLGGATDDAAAPVWFALGTAFLFSVQGLVISGDIPGVWRYGPASAVQPAVLFFGLTVATPLSLSLSAHAPAIAVLVGVGVGLVLISGFVELLMRANVPEVRAFEITSNLVQRTPLHLGMGFSMDRPVQTFAVETDDGQTQITTPWVHPGILEGIGGARLTPNVLATLNGQTDETPGDSEDNMPRGNSDPGDKPSGDGSSGISADGGNPGDDGDQGFFWHVPCTHLSDSPDPYVHEPVLDGVSDPETTGEASRLISRTYDETTFHGRRYGENRVVFFESDEFADIEVDIFGEVIDPERTLVVDRHVRVEETGRGEIHVDSPKPSDSESTCGIFSRCSTSNPSRSTGPATHRISTSTVSRCTRSSRRSTASAPRTWSPTATSDHTGSSRPASNSTRRSTRCCCSRPTPTRASPRTGSTHRHDRTRCVISSRLPPQISPTPRPD